MKFTVSSSALGSKLQAISKVINPKATNQILQDIVFKTSSNILTVTASDNETSLEAIVELAESDGDNQIAIPAKTLLEALKEIPEQPLTFLIDEATKEISVSYQNGQYSLVGHDADEYPQPSVLAVDASSHTLPASVFSAGLNRCAFAMDDNELRPVMNGIFLDFDTEHVAFVASDGHKLVCDKNSSYKSESRQSVILPKRPAILLKSLIGSDGEIAVSFDNRSAMINVNGYTMVCRLIEGRYPNYNSVIPANNPHHLLIDRTQLISALKRVSVFSPASSGLIRLRIKDNQLVISAQDLDFSTSATETLTCQYDGAPMSIGFKASFLIDILCNIPGQEITFKLADPSRAGVIVPSEQEENDDLLMLLMPMILND